MEHRTLTFFIHFMPDKFSISMLCEAAACVKGNDAAKTQKVPAGEEIFHKKNSHCLLVGSHIQIVAIHA